MPIFNRRGMTSLEWTLTFVAAAAAVIAAGSYVGRAYQGGLLRAADAVSSVPFLPGATTGTVTTTMITTRHEGQGMESVGANAPGITAVETTQDTVIRRDERTAY